MEIRPERPAVRPRPLLFVTLAGCAAVLLVDAGGAFLSRQLGFSYGWFAFVSIAVYAALGAAAARSGTAASAAIAGFVTALCDATVGWWISWQIGPGRIELGEERKVLTVVLTAMFVISFSTTIASVAGVIADRRRAAKTRPSA